MAKLDRLLNLTAALIDAEVPLTAEQVREMVPGYPDSDTAYHRSFERDKDDLRELGIPIETALLHHFDPPRAGYTIDRRRYELPDPGLTAEELASLHIASAAIQLDGIDGAEDALRKLGGGDAVPAASTLGSIPVPDAVLDAFAAVLERRPMAFDYGDNRRQLQPHRLEYEHGRWYVSGHDLDRDERRTFRIDRMTGDIALGEEDSFSPPADAQGVLLRPWEIGDGPATPAVVALDADIAPSVLADYPGIDVIERTADGNVIVQLHVRDLGRLRRFLVGLLDRGEVLSPPEYRQDLVSWLEGFVP